MRSSMIFVLFLSGCVTAGYHQRKIIDERNEQLNWSIQLAEQVQDGRLSARDMIKVLENRKK